MPWRVILAAILVCLVSVARVGPAGAEVGAGAYPTSQAIAADAQFLEYAPPPPTPGVVCLVDSGVDANPDTNGAVIGAEAEDPTWGTGDGLAQAQAPVEGHPFGHGTQMAMVMAAPQNGWGMVGIAPTSVRVYSIRVIPPGQTAFPFSAYTYAINRCLKLHITSEPAISVVNLSLGGTTTPSQTDLAFLEDPVDTARQHGLGVVAAAGNDGMRAVDFPAAYPPVVAVGAGDAGPGSVGMLCGFSNRNGLDIIAPGCDSVTGGIDEAFADDGTPAVGFGTSQAAAITSAALAAMRAYGPSLSVAEAELCLTVTEKNGGNIDVASAFDACGLADVVQAGIAAIPHPLAPPSGQAAGGPAVAGGPDSLHPIAPAVAPSLSRPRLGYLRLRRGKLVVTVRNRPTGASIEVKVLVKHRGRLVSVAVGSTVSSSVSFNVRAAYAVTVRFVLHGSVLRTSRWTTRVIG